MERQTAQNLKEETDDSQALLAQLGIGKKKKKSPKKIIVAAAAVLAAGIAVALFILLPKKDDDSTPAYREYTVERGDLIVGQSESSSISLLREVVEFPVTATVEEIYVKAGSSVKAGDPLIKLNEAEIAEGLSSYELQLQIAGLELEQAKLQQQTKLLAAEQKLETSNLNGELADETENLSVGELTNTYETAKVTLQQAQKEYDEYCAMNTDFANDNATLENYENTADYYESMLESYEKDENYINGYQSLINTAQTEKKKAESDGNLTKAKELEDKISSYNSNINSIISHYGSQTQLEQNIKAAETQWENASDAYDDYYDYFKEKYGTITKAKDLINKLATAEEAVYKADLSLEKARLNSETGQLTAEQTAETAKITAQTASTNYDLTEMELTQAVDAAQETYNEFEKQVEDAKSLIGEGGIVYAPTTGMIASITVEEGDEVTVEVDDETHRIKSYYTLMTMTRIEDVYIPITISEEDILSVSIGQDALVTMTAFPDKTFEARVDSITVSSSRAGAATVTYAVNVVFKDKNELNIFEGMSAEVTLLQKAVMDVLYVNNNAVTNTNGVSTVLVEDADGNAVSRTVKTGFTDGENVEIISGLNEGDTVLAESSIGKGSTAQAQSARQMQGGAPAEGK